MIVIFIRHGEPDKSYVDKKGFIGQGRDLAPLSERGKMQAEEVSHHKLLKGSQTILSSPYTRALQTAAVLSKNTGLNIHVEIDLHEFIPDKTFLVRGEEENKALHIEFMENHGKYPAGEARKWETIDEIIERTQHVLNRYFDEGYDKIIVVAHGGVIRRYTGVASIEYCEVAAIEYCKDFQCYGWV